MAKDEKTPLVANKRGYTFVDLLDDIMESAEQNDGESQDAEKSRRERQPKLIVVQMLIDLANSYNDSDYQKDEKLRNVIDVKVKDFHFDTL